MYDIKVVAANIRKVRLTRNYSQDYLAYKLNISQNGYSKIELGYTTLSVEKLIIIAKVLEVDPVKLMEAPGIEHDVEAISCIPVIPKLLEVICRKTGMGFAAVARVTDDKWIACGVRDEISFGLKPGSELKLETTICNEIRQSGIGVIIDNVKKDKNFACHHTPAMYGFQSYISIPIFRCDGSFFGTLCAIDPKPAKLNNPETIEMFKLFAELISFHLNLVEQRAFAEANDTEDCKRIELKKRFIEALGHELPNPVNAVLNSAKIRARF
jgi:transcriptional regulator with XRE-family HTH domain